jgi:hypothetical protein
MQQQEESIKLEIIWRNLEQIKESEPLTMNGNLMEICYRKT